MCVFTSNIQDSSRHTELAKVPRRYERGISSGLLLDSIFISSRPIFINILLEGKFPDLQTYLNYVSLIECYVSAKCELSP